MSVAAIAVALGVVGGLYAGGRIDFFAPMGLLALLSLPLAVALAAHSRAGLPPRTRLASLLLRCLLLLLLALCLADTQSVRQNDGTSVLYLLDHSASIPEKIRGQALDYVNAAAATAGKDDSAGIVVFGQNASVEVMPSPRLDVQRLYSDVDRNGTDLAAALELAGAAFQADTRRKIVLVTDGNETSGDVMKAVREAAANGAVVDVLPVAYDYQAEVLVEKLHLPDQVRENEAFDLNVHLQALQDCDGTLTILRNGVRIAQEDIKLPKGRSRYSVSLRIEEPGFFTFTARLSSESDTRQENNQASGFVYIQGASRILLVASAHREAQHLADACREDDLEVDVMTPRELPDSLGHLQNYDCIVLANVAADELTDRQMKVLQANVRDLGVGLIMVGGEHSFGAGGYEDTPLEEALPVSMDIQHKKINPKGALVLVLHTCEFADGNYWAKEITKRAIDNVNRQDDVGVLLYSGSDRWLFDLRPASDKAALFKLIDNAAPGDMPSFGPTIQMAYDSLSQSDAMVRHVIVISDGDPASPPPQTIKDMAAAGITISTVAINPHSPRDVDVMKYLAYQTGGRYYFAANPAVLPKIFIKEAKVVKRSVIFNEEFQPQLVMSTEVVQGVEPSELPPLMAYVATTPKPRALVPIVSDNENRDPILAYWRYGLGKAVAFTSDAAANWGAHWVRWDKYRKFWTQLVRWASRKREQSDLRLHTRIEGPKGRLLIDAVDRDGTFINFLKLNGRITDPDHNGSDLVLRQTAPGRYEAPFDASDTGVSIINVGYRNPRTGAQGFEATGVAVPYSAEFLTPGSDLPLMRDVASLGGGRILTGDTKRDTPFATSMPAPVTTRPIWEVLLLTALGVFLSDIVSRRVVINRNEISEAWQTVRAKLVPSRDSGPRDSTMDALLRRKNTTFQSIRPKTGKRDSFRAHLQQRAAGTGDGPSVKPETAGSEPATAPTQNAPATPSTSAEPEAGDEDSYTSRLLAAKRRARQNPSSNSASATEPRKREKNT